MKIDTSNQSMLNLEEQKTVLLIVVQQVDNVLSSNQFSFLNLHLISTFHQYLSVIVSKDPTLEKLVDFLIDFLVFPIEDEEILLLRILFLYAYLQLLQYNYLSHFPVQVFLFEQQCRVIVLLNLVL